MEDENKVRLHGLWASPYVRRVRIALEIKGIPYEYLEENMKKKSQLLLQHNPILKKVPVLIHGGNPIAESLVILEYIADTWKYSPYLLPQDPYPRSMVRFWADFMHNQIFVPLNNIIVRQGIEEEKAINEFKQGLSLLEENMKVIFPSDQPTSVDEEMGLLDILLSTLPSIIHGEEEAFDLKLIDHERYPLTCSRMTSLCGLPVVEDTAPSHHRLIKFYRAYRKFYTH